MQDKAHQRKILIVDDEPAIRRMLERIIGKIQGECTLASSAEEARGILKQEAFDLILCDIRLPGESGMDLISHIISGYPETAVIMVSGVDDPEVAEKALEIGAYGYIIKPFQVNEVIINVSSALRRQGLEIEKRIYLGELEILVADRTAKLRETLEGVIRIISLMVESRDPYTSGHQARVAKLASAMAEEMGFPVDQVEGIRMAAMIHDLGKISIPAAILSRPGQLSDVEFSLVKTHPQLGYDILKGIDFPWPLATIVQQHHEKMNGSGYPLGLSGKDILPEARIICVADVVEAMASHRPYRPAIGMEEALEEISKNRGVLYDPEAVKACLKLFREKQFAFDSSGKSLLFNHGNGKLAPPFCGEPQ